MFSMCAPEKLYYYFMTFTEHPNRSREDDDSMNTLTLGYCNFINISRIQRRENQQEDL